MPMAIDTRIHGVPYALLREQRPPCKGRLLYHSIKDTKKSKDLPGMTYKGHGVVESIALQGQQRGMFLSESEPVRQDIAGV